MTERCFPRLQERYVEKILSNGLTIRVLPKPRFDKLYAVLAVRYGSVDTTFEYRGQRYGTPAGVAHYLEHKMFDLPEGNAMQGFTELGGSPNAFTSYDMTAYYVQAVEHKEENLRLLLRMVLTPFFSEQSVRKERGIIGEEIKMYEDNADAQVYERLFEVMFPSMPLGTPIAGSLESIQKISAETLQLCYEAFYQPANMILCVEGDLAPETVFEIAEATSPAQRAEIALPVAPAEAECRSVQQVTRAMDVAMPMFALSIRLPNLQPGDDRTEVAADLAAELCAGEASACYRALYEQGLIDSSFYAGFESIREYAMLSFGGDSPAPEQVIPKLFAAARKLLAEGIDPVEFARLKKSAIGRKLRELDSFAGTCNRICGAFFDQYEYLDFRTAYDAVGIEDVCRILRLMTEDRAYVSTITPREEETSRV